MEKSINNEKSRVLNHVDIYQNDKYRNFIKKMYESGNEQMFAPLYNIPESDIISLVYFDPAKAVKITIVRPIPSGALGETDVYGAQQHAPLMGLEFEMG